MISAESKEGKDSHTKRNQAGKGKERHQLLRQIIKSLTPLPSLPADVLGCTLTPIPHLQTLLEVGRLKFGLANWEQVTSDPWICWVVLGYSLELVTTLHQVGDSLPKPILFAVDLSRLVSSSIHNLEQESAIQEK